MQPFIKSYINHYVSARVSGLTVRKARERSAVQMAAVDGLSVDFDDQFEVKRLVFMYGEFGLFQHGQQLGHFDGFRQHAEKLAFQTFREPLRFHVDLELWGGPVRMLFSRQPQRGREPRTLVGHQYRLDDSAETSHRVLVVQQVIAGGPMVPLVLHESHDLSGYLAAVVTLV